METKPPGGDRAAPNVDRPGGLIGAEHSRQPDLVQLVAAAVYDGRHQVGGVIERGRGQFEAADAAGRPIGVFPSMIAARDAVLDAGRRPETGRPEPGDTAGGAS